MSLYLSQHRVRKLETFLFLSMYNKPWDLIFVTEPAGRRISGYITTSVYEMLLPSDIISLIWSESQHTNRVPNQK